MALQSTLVSIFLSLSLSLQHRKDEDREKFVTKLEPYGSPFPARNFSRGFLTGQVSSKTALCTKLQTFHLLLFVFFLFVCFFLLLLCLFVWFMN